VQLNRTYSALLAFAALLLIAGGLLHSTGYAADPGIIPGAHINATIESVPPTWSEQTQSADSAGQGVTVTLSALLKDNRALGKATLNVSSDTLNWTSYETQRLSGTEALVTFRYAVPDNTPGTKMHWRIAFFDAAGNGAVTDTKSITITDITPPQILEQKQAADTIARGGSVLLSVRAKDNDKISSVRFESNETGEFMTVRNYGFNEQNVLTSMSWSNPSIKEGTVVGWHATVKDAWNNTKTSDTLTFSIRGCPVLPTASEWSNCDGGKQTQLYYECGAETNFTLILKNRTQGCIQGATREQAKSALDAAALSVETAKGQERDSAAAENLLQAAQVLYGTGDWDGAKAKADEAKAAAEAAGPISRPGINYLPYMAVVLILLGACWMLLKFGRLHLPVAEKFTPPPAPETSKGTGQVCGVCGKPFPKLYTCAECGTKVCFDDARTWEGKIFCINDLRKKGLL